MRQRPLFLLVLLLSPVAGSAQGTPYGDPQKRFTLQVPDGWTSRDVPDQGLIFSGGGLSFQVIPLPGPGSPWEMVAALRERISRSWRDLQEVDRKEVTSMGQPAAWAIYEGTDLEGTPGTVRIMGVQGGGAIVGVIVSSERTRYAAQRGTIEAVLATLRLGTNPPVAFATYPTGGGGNSQPAAEAAPPASTPPAGMGLEVRDLDDDDVRQFGLADIVGVVVEQVRPGGAADQAGIRQGDVMLQFDRTPVDGVATLERLLGNHVPGDAVELLMARNGRRKPVSLRLEAGEP